MITAMRIPGFVLLFITLNIFILLQFKSEAEPGASYDLLFRVILVQLPPGNGAQSLLPFRKGVRFAEIFRYHGSVVPDSEWNYKKAADLAKFARITGVRG